MDRIIPFPPSEILGNLSLLVEHPTAKSVINDLYFAWIPHASWVEKLQAIGKRSKDAIKTIKYIPADSRTPDTFMEPNGQTNIAYSQILDTIHKEDPKYPIEGIDNLSRMYMLPGFTGIECDICSRIVPETSHKELTTSKALADIYGLELKVPAYLCPFCFLCLCVEIEYLNPDITTPVPIPTLPDGRPVIWVGDPGWSKYPDEYRKLSLKYQGNF